MMGLFKSNDSHPCSVEHVEFQNLLIKNYDPIIKTSFFTK